MKKKLFDVKEEERNKKQITKEILLGILKTGAILGVAIMAPGMLRVIRDFQRQKEWEEYYTSSIEKVARRLYRKGFVKIVNKEGLRVVKITNKGKTEVLRYDLDKLEIKKPKQWDGKWRIVLFDIQEKYRRVRNLVREKLKVLGFFQFQESVFVYPYPCEKEIMYLREILAIPHSIKLMRADKIENDEDFRRIFKLR